MTFRFSSLVFKVSLLPFVAFVLLMPILISLGIWQMQRAEQKEMLLEQQQQRIKQPPMPINRAKELDLSDVKFRKAVASGSYDVQHQLLLDNQIVSGKAGYFVMTPFRFENSGSAILVNRGWVPLNPDRNKLPDIRFTPTTNEIAGRLNSFPSVGLKLAGADIPSAGWPAVVQIVNPAVIQEKLGYSIVSFQLQLDRDQENGYVREWHSTVAMPPEKHIAYAVQWFGLAVVLVVLFVIYGFKYERYR